MELERSMLSIIPHGSWEKPYNDLGLGITNFSLWKLAYFHSGSICSLWNRMEASSYAISGKNIDTDHQSIYRKHRVCVAVLKHSTFCCNPPIPFIWICTGFNNSVWWFLSKVGTTVSQERCPWVQNLRRPSVSVWTLMCVSNICTLCAQTCTHLHDFIADLFVSDLSVLFLLGSWPDIIAWESACIFTLGYFFFHRNWMARYTAHCTTHWEDFPFPLSFKATLWNIHRPN